MSHNSIADSNRGFFSTNDEIRVHFFVKSNLSMELVYLFCPFCRGNVN